MLRKPVLFYRLARLRIQSYSTGFAMENLSVSLYLSVCLLRSDTVCKQLIWIWIWTVSRQGPKLVHHTEELLHAYGEM